MTSPFERLPAKGKWPAILLAICCWLAPPIGADIAIVTVESTAVETLDEAQAKALWLGTLERVDGIKLAVADRSDGTIRDQFYAHVLHKTRGQIKAIRAKRAFQHGVAPPPEFPGEENVLSWVCARANRLGYVDADSVERPDTESAEDPAENPTRALKVLLVIEVPEGSEPP